LKRLISAAEIEALFESLLARDHHDLWKFWNEIIYSEIGWHVLTPKFAELFMKADIILGGAI
jgi:hypothetical protein